MLLENHFVIMKTKCKHYEIQYKFPQETSDLQYHNKKHTKCTINIYFSTIHRQNATELNSNLSSTTLCMEAVILSTKPVKHL